MEWGAQKMPCLPELQEMDDKQLNESLSQFYTEAPSKVVANFVSRTFCQFVMILKVVRKTGDVFISIQDLRFCSCKEKIDVYLCC